MTPIPGLPWLLAVPALIVKGTPYLIALFFYGQIFSTGYGFVKLGYQKFAKRPFPSNKVTRGLDSVVELLPNALGFVNKVLPMFGLPTLFIPPAPDLRAYMAATAGSVVVLPPGVVPPDAVHLPARTTAAGLSEALPPSPTPVSLPSDDPRPSVTVHRDGTVDVDAAPGSVVLLPPSPDAPAGTPPST